MKIIQSLLNKSTGLMKRLAGQLNPSGLGLSLSIIKKNPGDRSAASVQEEEHILESALRSVKHVQHVDEERKEKAEKKQKKQIAALIGAGIITNSQQAKASFRDRVDHQHQTTASIMLKGADVALKGGDQDWEHKINNPSTDHSNGITT